MVTRSDESHFEQNSAYTRPLIQNTDGGSDEEPPSIVLKQSIAVTLDDIDLRNPPYESTLVQTRFRGLIDHSVFEALREAKAIRSHGQAGDSNVTANQRQGHEPMYTPEQRAELITLVDQQFSQLGRQLSVPLEPRDSAFVTAALPEWLGSNMEYRLNVLWQEAPTLPTGCFVLSMDVDFGSYHRRMELTSGSSADLSAFATRGPPSRQICEAIFELMAMERAET